MLWSVFAFTDDTKQLPVIPGLCSGVGTMIYAGSIGTQIANELVDSNRCVSKCFVYVYYRGSDDAMSTAGTYLAGHLSKKHVHPSKDSQQTTSSQNILKHTIKMFFPLLFPPIFHRSSASSGPSSPFVMAQDKGPLVSSHTSTSVSVARRRFRF